MNEENNALEWARNMLHVDAAADLASLRAAFRRRSMETHPDRGGSADEFAEVARAYEALVANAMPIVELSDREMGLSDEGETEADDVVPGRNADGWVVDDADDDVDVRVVDEDAPPRRKRFEDMFLDALRREYRDE